MGQAGRPRAFPGRLGLPFDLGFLGAIKAPSPRLMHQVIRETMPRSREDRETPFGESRVVLVVQGLP